MRRLPALGIIGLLHPKVRIHQYQGLCRQVFNLQVPDRVVGGNEADGGEGTAGEPLVGVVIVQIGHPFSRTAAKFSDIMSRGGAGHQSQIDQSPTRTEGPPHCHGHMVHTGDMVQRAERRCLPAQTQQLIEILLPPELQKDGTPLQRHCRTPPPSVQKAKVQPGVEGERLPFPVKEQLKTLQNAQGSVPLGSCVPAVQLGIGQETAVR